MSEDFQSPNLPEDDRNGVPAANQLVFVYDRDVLKVAHQTATELQLQKGFSSAAAYLKFQFKDAKTNGVIALVLGGIACFVIRVFRQMRRSDVDMSNLDTSGMDSMFLTMLGVVIGIVVLMILLWVGQLQ